MNTLFLRKGALTRVFKCLLCEAFENVVPPSHAAVPRRKPQTASKCTARLLLRT